MHVGYRTPYNKGSRPRSLHDQASGSGSAGGEPTASPKSAARLAAEAAFSAPAEQPSQTPPTQVTVRKRRSTTLDPEAAMGLGLGLGLGLGSGLPTGDADRQAAGPRIFRVEGVKPQGAGELPGLAEAAAREQPPGESWGQRARRSQLQRPGPVTHTVLDLPERPVEPSVRQLKADLAAVEPLLEGIRRAQDTVFIDAAAFAAWQELSSRVDALTRELEGQLTQMG